MVSHGQKGLHKTTKLQNDPLRTITPTCEARCCAGDLRKQTPSTMDSLVRKNWRVDNIGAHMEFFC